MRAVKRVCVICEGKTEAEFVGHCLEPYFRNKGLQVYPSQLKGRPGNQGGGNISAERLAQHISHEYHAADRITTLVDYYRFKKAGERTRQQLEADILAEAGKRILHFNPSFVLPYVQMHEFEGLLFSDVNEFQWVLEAWNPDTQQALRKIRDAFPTPEDINNRPETAPSKRLEKIFGKKYSKSEHGPIIADAIGLHKICQECPLFDDWIKQLEQWGT